MTSELNRVDTALALALNTGIWALEREHLEIPVWETHRDTLAELLDDRTWEAVEMAVTTLPQVFDLHFPSRPARTAEQTTMARFVAWHAREVNAVARAKLVRYAAKPPLWRRVLFLRNEVWAIEMQKIIMSVEIPDDLREMAAREPAAPAH